MASVSLPKAGQRVAIRYEDRMITGRVGYASENQQSLLLQLDDATAEPSSVLPVVAVEGGLYRSIFDDREVWVEPIRSRAAG